MLSLRPAEMERYGEQPAKITRYRNRPAHSGLVRQARGSHSRGLGALG
jgi:hypothetical protein